MKQEHEKQAYNRFIRAKENYDKELAEINKSRQIAKDASYQYTKLKNAWLLNGLIVMPNG